jgi:hypothetical protein
MEEGSGTSTADVSGGGWTGSFNPPDASGPQWDADVPTVPASTRSIEFDGTGDQIDVTGFKGVTGTTARTMSAWVKLTDGGNGQNRSIMSWGTDSSTQKWIFRVQSNNGQAGAIRVEVNGGFIVGETDITDGLWHHVAATWENDGSPNVQDVLLYVDGVYDGVSDSLSRGVNTASGADVRIGNGHSNRRWKGGIDDAAIWDRALSSGEIKQLANGVAPNLIPEPGTLLVWSLLAGLGVGLRWRRRK